jgi:hypothetical protein
MIINRKQLENLKFYGKKVSEMNELQKTLLETDIKLVCSMECQRLGITMVDDSGDDETTLGTQEGMIDLSIKRLGIVSKLLHMNGAPDNHIILVSENSIYRFSDFLKDIFGQIKSGLVKPIEEQLSPFTHPFSMN